MDSGTVNMMIQVVNLHVVQQSTPVVIQGVEGVFISNDSLLRLLDDIKLAILLN